MGYSVSTNLSPTERLAELNAQLARGNHKSASTNQAKNTHPNLLLHIQQYTPNTLLCTVSATPNSPPQFISSTYTLFILRRTCAMFGGQPTFGFSPSEIGNRSIRSGAAMALFLKNHSTAKIMILGRWSSDAFLVYIRPQVLEWTNNMSTDMVSFDSFLDVGLYDITSSHDPRTRRPTIPLNGRSSSMPMPSFHLQG